MLKMDKGTRPSGPKTSRTQQGVVAIFEVTDPQALIARAKAAGATSWVLRPVITIRAS